MIDGGRALRSVLRQLDLSDELLSPLLAYAHMVERDADRLGLVSRRGVEEFLGRHVAESLAFALVRRPQPGERWLDVGSGAGLPGIPLSICFPSTQFTLVEPQQRRAGFLELTAIDLGLSSVHVLCQRVQEVSERGEVAVARAFSSQEASGHSEATLALLAGVTGPGGVQIVQIAKDAGGSGAIQRFELEPGNVDSAVDFLIMRNQ